jgi:hypothetical protein
LALEAETPVANAQNLLLKTLFNPTNQSWCHEFNGDGERKWLQQKRSERNGCPAFAASATHFERPECPETLNPN